MKLTVEEMNFGLIEGSDLWERNCALQNVVEHFIGSLGRGAAEIKVCDVVVIGDVVSRHRWRLWVVAELIKSNDKLVRGAKVKAGKTRNVIRCPVNSLYPTELHATEKLCFNIRNVRKTKKKDVGNDNSTKVTRSKRDDAVAGELRRRLNETDANP